MKYNWHDLEGNKAFTVCLWGYAVLVLVMLIRDGFSNLPIVEFVFGAGIFCFILSPIVAGMAAKILKMSNDTVEYIVCTMCFCVVIGVIYIGYLVFHYILTIIPGTIQYNSVH